VLHAAIGDVIKYQYFLKRTAGQLVHERQSDGMHEFRVQLLATSDATLSVFDSVVSFNEEKKRVPLGTSLAIHVAQMWKQSGAAVVSPRVFQDWFATACAAFEAKQALTVEKKIVSF
jgi:hypothetical protein